MKEGEQSAGGCARQTPRSIIDQTNKHFLPPTLTTVSAPLVSPRCVARTALYLLEASHRRSLGSRDSGRKKKGGLGYGGGRVHPAHIFARTYARFWLLICFVLHFFVARPAIALPNPHARPSTAVRLEWWKELAGSCLFSSTLSDHRLSPPPARRRRSAAALSLSAPPLPRARRLGIDTPSARIAMDAPGHFYSTTATTAAASRSDNARWGGI
ncbi:hypothetical protein C8R45DRAFT_1099658 [Mycena sanguinolenta]|nr:hypothetical protein C8R45DRAFT_1099658 [Mycena sanguinolenta]